MATIVGTVDSLAAVENAVCVSVIVAHCLCIIVQSRKEHADQHNTASVPLLAPAITRDSGHN